MLRSRDTSERAFEQQLEMFRSMTPGERLAIGAAMSDEIRRLAEAGIRDRHPSYSDTQIGNALAHILLGPELAAKVDQSRLAKRR
jgi:hypothetical protein